MSIIYLDNMASTPLAPEVTQAMTDVFDDAALCANPDATHDLGQAANTVIESARNTVASIINAPPESLIWTSGATESNNIAIQGAALAYQRQGKHIVTLSTEHKAVLNVCQHLNQQGFEITYLKPEPNGLLHLDQLKAAMQPDTILVSIAHVNNEIGVIQDIAAIADVVHQKGALLHVDAAQSMGKVRVDVQVLQADAMSFSAHKAYGPKGVGALYLRQQPKLRLAPIMLGGGQEQGLRPGTLATHQIVGMAKAFALADAQLAADCEHIHTLQQCFWDTINKALPRIQLNGDPTQRVPHNLNISFAGVDGESLMFALHEKLAVSSGSACNAATLEPSHVLTALGVPRALADSSIRFSFGRYNTLDDIKQASQHVIAAVQRLRRMSPLWDDGHV